MYINTEVADKYQEFFSFFSQEHNLILTIEQMQEILSEAQKLEGKLSHHAVNNSYTLQDMIDAYDAGVWNPQGETAKEYMKREYDVC